MTQFFFVVEKMDKFSRDFAMLISKRGSLKNLNFLLKWAAIYGIKYGGLQQLEKLKCFWCDFLAQVCPTSFQTYARKNVDGS